MIGKNIEVRRGDIWVCDLKPIYEFMLKGLHPCLMLSNYRACSNSYIIQAVPISSKQKSQPTHVELDIDCGLSHKSICLCEQLTTIGKDSLKYQIGKISYNKMLEVQKAVNMQLGFENSYTNLDDIKKVQEMISNIQELDRFLKHEKSIEIMREREVAFKCLEYFAINHSIELDLSNYYSQEFKKDRWEVNASNI